MREPTKTFEDLPDPKTPVITILGSGVALGVYVPALLISRQLRLRGLATDVVVLESMFLVEKKAKILENKAAFHQNFAVARMGQRLARENRSNIDPPRLEEMYQSWAEEERRFFIVVSGFWMPFVAEYRRRIATAKLTVHLLHMDAVVSVSWKNVTTTEGEDHHIWLFRHECQDLPYQLRVNSDPPKPYPDRPERYLIHGGGWGIGTYQSKIPELEAGGLALDILLYNTAEVSTSKSNHRYFMIDPAWSPWIKNREQEHEFPPFGRIIPGAAPQYRNRPGHHELFDLARFARAIISKPGGATLVDSLAGATPLIMLEPFGDYEQKNAELWQALGFGIPYQTWRKSGFAPELLEPLHQNLLRSRSNIPDYLSTWAPLWNQNPVPEGG
jgi:hypothetical protein